MKKFIILFCIVFLSGCFLKSEKIHTLPNAKLGVPYSEEFELTNRVTSERAFNAEFTPADSGLAIEPVDRWYTTFIISGTPKVKGDINIEIYYSLKGGPANFFESASQTKLYKIKVEE